MLAFTSMDAMKANCRTCATLVMIHGAGHWTQQERPKEVNESADQVPEGPRLTMPIDAPRYRQIIGHFATGVTVITTAHEGWLHGMTANAVTSVSLDPVLLLVCVDKTANMHEQIVKAGRFAVNILTDEQEDVSRTFAATTEPEQNALQGVAYKLGRTAHRSSTTRWLPGVRGQRDGRRRRPYYLHGFGGDRRRGRRGRAAVVLSRRLPKLERYAVACCERTSTRFRARRRSRRGGRFFGGTG